MKIMKPIYSFAGWTLFAIMGTCAILIAWLYRGLVNVAKFMGLYDERRDYLEEDK